MLGCFAALWALAMTTSPTNPNPILLGPLVPFTSDHLPVAPEAALTQASEAEEFAAVSAMQLPKASVARRQAPPALSSAFLNVAACGMPAPRAGFFLAAAREPTEAHADVSALDMHRLHPLAQKSLAKLVHMLGSARNSSLHRAAVASDSNAAEVVRPFDWIAHARSWQSAHGRRRGVSAQQMPFEQAEKALEQAAAAEAAAAQAEAAQLADAVCVGSDEDINGAGNTSLLFVLLLITIGLLVLDAVQLWATLARVPALLAASARPEPTAKPGNHDSFSDTTPTSYGLVTDRPTTCTTTATTAEEGGMSSEAPKGGGDEGGGDDTDAGGLAVHKKPPAGSADASGAAAAPSDEEPMIVDAQTWLILTLTTLPAFSSDLYFSMLAPFLPGAAEARGLPSSIVGLIFACVPIGSALAALGVPALLARPTSDAYSLIRRATLANAALVACAGLAGNVPLAAGHGVPFGATLGVIRLLQGVCTCNHTHCPPLATTRTAWHMLPHALPATCNHTHCPPLATTRTARHLQPHALPGTCYHTHCPPLATARHLPLPATCHCQALAKRFRALAIASVAGNSVGALSLTDMCTLRAHHRSAAPCSTSPIPPSSSASYRNHTLAPRAVCSWPYASSPLSGGQSSAAFSIRWGTHLPTSPHISTHLPISPHISTHLHTYLHISPHLPTSPHICSAPVSPPTASVSSPSCPQSGCWALPFTAGCAALLSSALLMLLGLGRQAPPALKPRAHEMSATQLLSIGDTWLVALPTLLLSMTASFLEPSWQLYLGSPPYSLSPTNIGVFLQVHALSATIHIHIHAAMKPTLFFAHLRPPRPPSPTFAHLRPPSLTFSAPSCLHLQATTLEYLLVLVCAGFALPIIGSAVQMSLGCVARAMPSSPCFPWCHVDCPPNPPLPLVPRVRCTLATIGLLLIGPCPLLRAHVPQTEVAVLLGTMITFGGVGLAVPALTPMALEVYEKHGYTQRQVAGVSAALFTGLINVANIGGPLLGGTLKEASGGLPLATTLYGALTGGVCALCCGKLLAMYVRSRCCGVRSGRGEREM